MGKTKRVQVDRPRPDRLKDLRVAAILSTHEASRLAEFVQKYLPNFMRPADDQHTENAVHFGLQFSDWNVMWARAGVEGHHHHQSDNEFCNQWLHNWPEIKKLADTLKVDMYIPGYTAQYLNKVFHPIGVAIATAFDYFEEGKKNYYVCRAKLIDKKTEID